MVNRRILACVAFLLFGLVQTPRVSVAQQSVAQQPSGASLPDGRNRPGGGGVPPSSCCTATPRRRACGAP